MPLPAPELAHTEEDSSTVVGSSPPGRIDDTPKETADELVAAAEELLNQLAGRNILVGFHTQLRDALNAVKGLSSAPKMNYRCVRHLKSIVNLTDKVVRVVDESGEIV